jgi:hypothetical protein
VQFRDRRALHAHTASTLTGRSDAEPLLYIPVPPPVTMTLIRSNENRRRVVPGQKCSAVPSVAAAIRRSHRPCPTTVHACGQRHTPPLRFHLPPRT